MVYFGVHEPRLKCTVVDTRGMGSTALKIARNTYFRTYGNRAIVTR